MSASSKFMMAIHGGSGVMPRESMPASMDALARAALAASLTAGHAILKDGGSALDAVTASVIVLEDDPLFNAGRGAVFTAAGNLEMDAAIMDGRERSAGAVIGVVGPRNPVLAARAVMERSEHAMLFGESAVAFCRRHGVALADFDHFFTPHRWRELQSELERQQRQRPSLPTRARHGTVGAVALDRHGNLAAATSTGGYTAKSPGRIGDTPVIGAGTWADNATCAISATGIGEYFLRGAAAHEIAARMRYRGDTLRQAASSTVAELGAIGGEGGVVAVDRTGEVSLAFNDNGMFRGMIGPDGVAMTAIFREELSPTGTPDMS